METAPPSRRSLGVPRRLSAASWRSSRNPSGEQRGPAVTEAPRPERIPFRCPWRQSPFLTCPLTSLRATNPHVRGGRPVRSWKKCQATEEQIIMADAEAPACMISAVPLPKDDIYRARTARHSTTISPAEASPRGAYIYLPHFRHNLPLWHIRHILKQLTFTSISPSSSRHASSPGDRLLQSPGHHLPCGTCSSSLDIRPILDIRAILTKLTRASIFIRSTWNPAHGRSRQRAA
jgi:hypothetical protein